MATILGRDDRWLVIPGAISLVAWCAVAGGVGGVTATAICTSGMPSMPPSAASLDLFLALNPPSRLAAGWALMLAAMMPPLIVAPLRHLRDQGFARHRGAAMLAFAAGYGVVWMAAGVALQALALALRMVEPAAASMLGLAILVAAAWQISPARQRCLNRCHEWPTREASDPFAFGLAHGAGCVGVCWALMLPPLLVAGHHLPAMAGVALFLFAERLEPPAPPTWRLRVPGKALWVASKRTARSLISTLPPLLKASRST